MNRLMILAQSPQICVDVATVAGKANVVTVKPIGNRKDGKTPHIKYIYAPTVRMGAVSMIIGTQKELYQATL